MLERLRITPSHELPKVKSFFDEISEEDGHKIFQGIKLSYYDTMIMLLTQLKN